MDKILKRISSKVFYIKGFMLVTVIMIALFSFSFSSYGEDEPLAEYTGENGVKIISYSHEWSALNKLQAVYFELMSNGHGPEMALFDAVYIYPEERNVASLYYDRYQFINNQYVYMPERYIEIYDGDRLTEVEDIARILSHEYGHHFMFYYLIVNEQIDKPEWANGTYGELRHLDDYELITYLGNEAKPYDHKWDVAEILADDYVQLYGSDLARHTRDYMDVEERLDAGASEYYYYYNDFNLLPQENLTLELAADIEGLSNYFVELTGVETLLDREIDVPEPYLLDINQVYKTFNEYIFTWDPIDDEELYEYTLVLTEAGFNDYPLPLKTVLSNETLSAVGGSAINVENNQAILGNLQGDYELMLFAKDESGVMHGSNPVAIHVSPADNSPIQFSDIPENYWAIDDIYKITSLGVVEGYPDGTFKPENSITRAEIMTFLVRSLSDYNVNPVNFAPNWFVEQGYANAAVHLGLINSNQNNPGYYFKAATREEIASYMYRLLPYKDIKRDIEYVSGFTDINTSRYIHAISVIDYYGIIDGYPDYTYKPKQNATRAEAIKLIERFMTLMGYM